MTEKLFKVNTSTVIKGLDDKPLKETILDGDGKKKGSKDLTLGAVVSQILTQDNKIKEWNPLKSLAVAQRFYSGKVIELDEGDISTLRTIIEKDERWTPLVRGRILQIIIEVKSKEKD